MTGAEEQNGLADHELDAVAAQMARAGSAPRGALSAQQITGGRSNLTYRLRDLAEDEGHLGWVLRMPPRAGRTPSAHDVGREHRVTAALLATDVPVAEPVVHCEDHVVGFPFSVARFVEGSTVQSRSDLDALGTDGVAAVTQRLVETLAALHRVDHQRRGLTGFGRGAAYAARQLRRWSEQWRIVGRSDTTASALELVRRLKAYAFTQRATGIVHGDYRIDNTLLTCDDAGLPRVAAVVDWELSTIGDPVADVAMMCVYRHPALDLVLGGPSAWTSDRLPGADGIATAYESAGGVELADWDAHLALGCLKLAVIAAGIDHRFRAGATTGAGFDRAGEAVAPLFQAGLQHLPAVS